MFKVPLRANVDAETVFVETEVDTDVETEVDMDVDTDVETEVTVDVLPVPITA